MQQLNYTKAIVIVHGKSEKQICQHVKSKLRLKMEIVSNNNGESSIQITSVKQTLNNTIFKSYNSFIKKYEDVKLSSNNKSLDEDFKIFIILDTDDCTENQKSAFINKKMFKSHWAYDHIVPIYDSPNLEEVLKKANVPFTKTGDKRKKEYVKLFPTDPKYEKSDEIQIQELCDNLKKQTNTNLNEFLDFCLKAAE
ncbi:putative uncharacterized protein [Coprobacillus sp. CAG:605]|nr:putative uncharacterized protein [Coprobacillus sp. CAG:605]